MSEHRCPGHAGLLTVCSTSSVGVLRGNGGHERIFSLEAPFSFKFVGRCCSKFVAELALSLLACFL